MDPYAQFTAESSKATGKLGYHPKLMANINGPVQSSWNEEFRRFEMPAAPMSKEECDRFDLAFQQAQASHRFAPSAGISLFFISS